MFTIQFLAVYLIGILFLLLIETHQHSIVSPARACVNTVCGSSSTLDLGTCLCIDTESVNDSNSVRNGRSSDKLFVSKVIRDDASVMQATSVRCRNDEQWNGRECIPLISVCPGGYHWNGHACIIQVLTKTIALVPTGPDTKCAQNAKKRQQAHRAAIQTQPMTVMPSYSTSPMCPFGFIWSGDKCIHNPPTCPSRYVFRDDLCHLVVSLPANFIATTVQPIYERQTTESKQALEYEIDNSAAEVSTENGQNHRRCCTMMSPRICRRIVHNRSERWQCYHHQFKRCGEFCTKPTLYLRPKKTMFVEPLLIIPPPPRRLQKLLSNSAYRETNIGKLLTHFPLLYKDLLHG